MKFLRNQWYTAAASGELGERPLARTVCSEPLVIFRGCEGEKISGGESQRRAFPRRRFGSLCFELDF